MSGWHRVNFHGRVWSLVRAIPDGRCRKLTHGCVTQSHGLLPIPRPLSSQETPTPHRRWGKYTNTMTIQNDAPEGKQTPTHDARSYFYNSVLPPVGLRALAVFKDGLNRAPAHYFSDTDADLLTVADSWDAKGINVYHGCATYSTDANRKGGNVQAIKSLFADLDVGPKKPYATQKEAVVAYEKFRLEIGLPAGYIVSSGNGVHVYHSFINAITPEQWDRLAALFAQCMDHFGVKHDSSRTEDKASILRIPGTSNYKAQTPKAVTIKRVGVEAPVSEIWQALKAYADSEGLIVGASKGTKKVHGTNDIIGNRQVYPPSYPEHILPKCAVLREVADTGGNVPYEIWWRAMGVAKFLEDGEAVAAHWTRNRASTGHGKTDYQGVMDAWTVGPTTCNQFEKHCDQCKGCTSYVETA